MDVSIVIRTYNEERLIGELLEAIFQQTTTRQFEVIVVDSESNDRTLEIIKQFPVKLKKIRKADFTFGHSLNVGIEEAQGRRIVVTSGHCIPMHERWLDLLVEPLEQGNVGIVFGRQIGTNMVRNGHPSTRFSERKIFEKHYPPKSIPICSEPFLNNANGAFNRDLWEKLQFDASLPGLEDIDFALRASALGVKSAYVADAVVLHLHDENNARVFNRFFREEIAMCRLKSHSKPRGRLEIAFEFIRNLFRDLLDAAKSKGGLKRYFVTVLGYRAAQYFGIYLAHYGNHPHKISIDQVHDVFLRLITKGFYNLRALRLNKDFAKCWY